jgi:hypothetical protein
MINPAPLLKGVLKISVLYLAMASSPQILFPKMHFTRCFSEALLPLA